jgi:ABC-type sugar transport system ATPase subunit
MENPREAKQLGIETTFQELAIVNNLTVTENIFLGREDTIGSSGPLGILKRSRMRKESEELLTKLGIDIDPEQKAGNLSGGERQLVAISRTVLSDPHIVIMDEPTSALSVEGARQVLDLIGRMQDQGISILLISHNLDYLMEITDRIHVLHNGQDAGTIDTSSTSQKEITSRMISGLPSEKETMSP